MKQSNRPQKGIELAEKRKQNLFLWALCGSILFVIGIPLIILTAGKIWILMALGIVFVVFGFYGTPILWVQFANQGKMLRILQAVICEHLFCVQEIVQHLQYSEQEVRSMLTQAIQKQYLTGFVFDGNVLQPNEKAAPKTRALKCEYCGGNLQEGDLQCPYCGSRFEKF